MEGERSMPTELDERRSHFEGPASAGRRRELDSLMGCVREIRSHLSRFGSTALRRTHLPHATDQLGAVVQATERAANSIMDACDALEDVAGMVGGEAAILIRDAVTQIYEACGFQDPTGQRIRTVTRTLEIVEDKLGQLGEALGIPPEGDGLAENVSLRDGPQLPAQAIDQSAIDTLLAEQG
jgi:chemotaxis protein CheZ